ncbi:IS4-like element ISGsu1 family transposase [Arenicella sp. 4NH20-0111]|uniref:IS4 family transposase n=1 Tax=Arenicella sp. 4NH20-0111 TaxID=3127648 RepID=UPI003109C572
MGHHNTVFSQILKLVPRHEFSSLSMKHDGVRRRDAMSRWTQFVDMASAQLTGRSSLRDVELTLERQSNLRYHLGTGSVKRTTLARTNKQLSAGFYQALFSKLYSRCQSYSPRHYFRFKKKLFSLDASLINVSLKVFPHRDYNRKKAAYKLHVGLDHDGLIPAFAAVTAGKVGDQMQAKLMSFPKDSVVVFDKGYADYSWHNQLTEKGIFWVTRIRSNAKYRVLERRKVNHSRGITSDQTIEYTAKISRDKNLNPVRRIGFYDEESDKHYVFITNHFEWSANTISQIYKQRWQVELFFKWVKQNLKIKSFLGNKDNAVMTQIMMAMCTYLILAFIKFQSKFKQSLQQMVRLIQTNLFAKRSLIELFNPPPPVRRSPQMSLLV